MKDFQFFLKIIRKSDKISLIRLIGRSDFYPIVLSFFLLVALSLVNIYVKKEIAENKTLSLSFSYNAFPYPLISSNYKNLLRQDTKVLGISSENNAYVSYDPSDISAEAFVVMDDDSKVIILSKNENFNFSTASTAKIMTALVSLDYFGLKDVLTVKKDEVEGSSLHFKTGQRFYFEDLLYAMLLPSANDAAYAIAQSFPYGEEAFVEKMNEKAKLFNLSNTHFQDPAGLLDDDSYTTPLDLAMLSSIAIKNPVISRIVGTKEKEIYDVSFRNKYELKNLNRLLGYQGVRGIKTGQTDGAGGVLSTLKEKTIGNSTKSFIIVVMKSQDRFSDTQKLINILEDVNFEQF